MIPVFLGPLLAVKTFQHINPTMTRGSFVDVFTVNGYSATTYSIGSLGSPNTFKGQSITDIYSISTDSSLSVTISGNLSKGFFTYIDCSLGRFYTADASHTPGGSTVWGWASAGMFASSGTEGIVIAG